MELQVLSGKALQLLGCQTEFLLDKLKDTISILYFSSPKSRQPKNSFKHFGQNSNQIPLEFNSHFPFLFCSLSQNIS